MSRIIKLKKGLDIKLKGEAEKSVRSIIKSEYYALKPTDFKALTPRLEVKVDDQVKAGDVLFTDKFKPEIRFTSPVSGTVHAINRGEKRRILEIVVKADESIAYKDFSLTDISRISREEIISSLLDSGLWPLIKQRPYDIIANPENMPKAIVVSGFDTAPLAPDIEMVLKREHEALQAGFDCLSKLINKPVNLNLHKNQQQASVFNTIRGVEVNYFSGPHPSGNVGVQIHHINPINKGEYVWTINVQDVAIIGRFFLSGKYDVKRMIALAGSEVKVPAYYNVLIGTQISAIVDNRLKNQLHQRIISGNVLTGNKVEPDSFLGFYSNMVTVIPEGDQYEFLGWASPGLSKFSLSKTFPTFLFPGKRYRLDANLHGERRAFVVTGQYNKVLPMDIYPVFLLKAILAKDLDKMEQLGMYEIIPEDMALCEFVCTSKIPVQKIVNEGIELMIKELS